MARRRKYRRNPSTRDLLLYAGLGVAGYLIYDHMKGGPAIAKPAGPVFVAQPMPNAPIGTAVPGVVTTIATAASGVVDAFKGLLGGGSPPIVSPPPTPAPTSGLGSLG